jgi:glycosyltransferase involved in cell wall biosynthesis
MAHSLRLYSRNVWHSTYYSRPTSWAGPEVQTVVDMIPERFPELFHQTMYRQFRGYKRACVLAADLIICTTESTRADVVNFYSLDPTRVRLTPLAASDIFRPLPQTGTDSSSPARRPFLLYVGERYHYKNFVGMLDAFESWGRRDEVDLVVVGRPWSRSEVDTITERRLQDHVCLVSGVDDEHLCRLYCHATALVFPSLYEGFGIPLLEALACGCLIVASEIPSSLEVAGDLPFYFKLNNVDSFHVALDAALDSGRDPVRVRRGIARASAFSWERTARATLEALADLS